MGFNNLTGSLFGDAPAAPAAAPAVRKKPAPKAPTPARRKPLPNGRPQHFTPPSHIHTSACGYTTDDCVSDAQAREWLASEFGIQSADQMTRAQLATAGAAGWCVTCLDWGFCEPSEGEDNNGL